MTVAEEWVALYQDLHRNPELSFQETRTAAIVASRLRDLGYDVTEGVGRTGVVGLLVNGDGPVVLLRADMDALPVAESTGLDYASTARGTDPEGKDVAVMHALSCWCSNLPRSSAQVRSRCSRTGCTTGSRNPSSSWVSTSHRCRPA